MSNVDDFGADSIPSGPPSFYGRIQQAAHADAQMLSRHAQRGICRDRCWFSSRYDGSPIRDNRAPYMSSIFPTSLPNFPLRPDQQRSPARGCDVTLARSNSGQKPEK